MLMIGSRVHACDDVVLLQLMSDGKVFGAEARGVRAETTTVPSIFALGDCLHGKPELTPVCCDPQAPVLTRR
jgi:hypothetical protein